MVNSKDKGGRGERQAIKLLEGWWGSKFVKTPQSGGFSTKAVRDEWNAAADIVTPDETFPFTVEVKWWKDWSLDQILTAPKTDIWDWWEQAKDETTAGKFTLLVFKKNYQDFFIMMKMEEDFSDYQKVFTESSRIRAVDRQDEYVYIRLFKDLLQEPKDKWIKNQ